MSSSAPPLVACIDGHRTSRPGIGEPYVEYCIVLKHAGHRWSSWRRYSEFNALRDALRRTVHAARKPLPSKGFTRHATGDVVAGERAVALSAWLENVLHDGAALGSPSLLAFVGLASVEGADRRGPMLHVRAIGERGSSGAPNAESGDLILFRTKAAVPTLQRVATNSHWDHVGLLVFLDGAGRLCRAEEHWEAGFLECDINGCRFYALRHYESQQWHLQYEEICIRRLMWSGRGTSDATRTLQAWYEEVIGRPYELTVAKLVGRKPAAGRAPAADAADAAPTVSTTRHVTASGPTNDSPKGFFCSELAAHAYKALGLLPPERPASGYWPVSFGQAAALQLEGGAAFGDEVPIDFHTPAVDGLRPEAAAVRARAWSEAAADFMNG